MTRTFGFKSPQQEPIDADEEVLLTEFAKAALQGLLTQKRADDTFRLQFIADLAWAQAWEMLLRHRAVRQGIWPKIRH